MKHFALTLGLLMTFCIDAPSNDFSGSYFSQKADCGRIVINDSLFYFICAIPGIYSTDTLCCCTIKRLTDDFFEINSIPPFADSTRLNVKRNIIPSDSDSISFKLCVPSKKKLDVSCWWWDYGYDVCSHKRSSLSDGICEFNIARTSKYRKFEITVSPRFIEYYFPENTSRSIVRKTFVLDSLSCDQNIELYIPLLTDYYFEQFWIEGEYVRILTDTIVWRGISYVKEKISDSKQRKNTFTKVGRKTRRAFSDCSHFTKILSQQYDE